MQGDGAVDYLLGVAPTGIVIYRNKVKISSHFWWVAIYCICSLSESFHALVLNLWIFSSWREFRSLLWLKIFSLPSFRMEEVILWILFCSSKGFRLVLKVRDKDVRISFLCCLRMVWCECHFFIWCYETLNLSLMPMLFNQPYSV